ncbi:hypothetical protein [Pedobacter sp.]|uniref:hypothetical protein n=1 Tax=Pedobacter sp. TaxID=1411316 RepID=UPI003D7FCF10
MKQFQALFHSTKLTANEMADVFESFISGAALDELAEKYKLPSALIYTYLYRHYYGVVPKENQIKITLKSKV